MGPITLGPNPSFTLPAMDITGTPAGIVVRKCVDNGIAPVINTGIAHGGAGIGPVGAEAARGSMPSMIQPLHRLAGNLINPIAA